MTTGLAILTMNRLPVLLNLLKSVQLLESTDRIGVFDDGSMKDDTALWLRNRCLMPGGTPVAWDHEYAAYVGACPADTDFPAMDVYLGHNVGIAANSNRALRWFLKRTNKDVLMLVNDDLLFTGPADTQYSSAHRRSGIGLLCYCPTDWKGYDTVPVTVAGVPLRLLTRLTGPLMSVTRKCVESIGYFETAFGTAGEEHCDYTYRAFYSGHQDLKAGMAHAGIDVAEPLCVLQDCASSIDAEERKSMDKHAAAVMQSQAVRYTTESHFRPYRLYHLVYAGGRDNRSGIPISPRTPVVSTTEKCVW